MPSWPGGVTPQAKNWGLGPQVHQNILAQALRCSWCSRRPAVHHYTLQKGALAAMSTALEGPYLPYRVHVCNVGVMEMRGKTL